MALFRRKPKLPAERRPTLEPDERIVAWAAAPDGDVVATNRGLFLPGQERLGWHQIHKVTWSGSALTVVPAEVVSSEDDGYLVTADLWPVAVTLADPGDLPDQVRTRVTRSVAYTSHHLVPGGGLRIAARRVSGVDGLTWTVRFDPGTHSDEPAVRTATAELVAAARETT